MKRYLDFDLLFRRTDTGYRAEVVGSPAGEASSDFNAPFSDLELENLLLRIGRPRRSTRRIGTPEMNAVKTFGGRLFSAVFAADVLACFRVSVEQANAQDAGLRIRLRLSEVPELANLPWEYLYNATLNRFLSLSAETPVVRYLNLPERIQPLHVDLPIRVLVMVASPDDYPPLDVEAEWSRLKNALADLEAQGRVIVERLPNATLPALQRRLRGESCHVFHFIGHGGFSDQSADGLLVLEGNAGRGDPVSGQYLGTLLHDHRPLRVAVLNACEGARGGRTDPFAGTAQSLVQQGIPAVIAMQFEITDDAAVIFAHELYLAIADGCAVDTALAEARKALFAQVNEVEWGTPVLYMRASDGRIFDVASTPQAQPVPERAPALEAQRPVAAKPDEPPPTGPGPVTSPRVYISYSWDSVEHKQRVLALSNALRGDGIETHLDQYEVGPPSWKQWQEHQVNAGDFVLMVCTEEYRRRVEEEPGRGAYTDGELIRARLTVNANHAWLVVLGFGHYRDNRASIPAFAGDTEYYNVGHPDGYKRLLARLRGQPLEVPPPVRPRTSETARRPGSEQAVDKAPPAIAEPTGLVETKRSSVFVSYSHLDAKWLRSLQPHFESLRLEHPSFELWDDTRIQPGADWRKEIRTALTSARVAVLLVSKSFLASKFIQNEELPQLLSSAQEQGTLLLAALLSPSRFEHVDALARFQTVNPPSKTLAEMSGPERERVFVKLTERIAAALKAG